MMKGLRLVSTGAGAASAALAMTHPQDGWMMNGLRFSSTEPVMRVASSMIAETIVVVGCCEAVGCEGSCVGVGSVGWESKRADGHAFIANNGLTIAQSSSTNKRAVFAEQ